MQLWRVSAWQVCSLSRPCTLRLMTLPPVPVHLLTREGLTYCTMQWSIYDVGTFGTDHVTCLRCRAIYRERNGFAPAEWD